MSAKRIWTASAVVLLASLASSQAGPAAGGGLSHMSGKSKPTVPVTGHPLCFGDGTGTACPFRNMGDPGRGCDNSLGTGGALLWARGAANVDNDSLRLFVQGVPHDTLVMYVQGSLSVDEGMGRVFGDGLMCVSGPIVKLGSASAWQGRSAFPPDGRKGSIGDLGGIPARGGTRYYQAFYRDHPFVASGAVFNSTNAWSEVWMP